MMNDWRFPHRLVSACLLFAVAMTAPCPAFTWGDEGHEIIALIAEHYLDPAARAKVAMLLAVDTDTLTGPDIASVAIAGVQPFGCNKLERSRWICQAPCRQTTRSRADRC
jgi:hypothetical protein